jgi:MFS family permease
MTESSRKPKNLLSHSYAYWVVSTAFFIAMMLVTAPTPLYELWEVQDQFSTAAGTVVFSMNTFGILLGLYFTAHISNQLGRRRTMIIALAALMLACIIFIFEPEFTGILGARLLTGLGIGTVTATAISYLTELRLIAQPHSNPRNGAIIVTCITMGGFAMGDLMTAILIFTTSAPLTTPFVVIASLLLAVTVTIFFIPETTTPELRNTPYSPQHLSIPHNARPAFFVAATGAFSSYAILGFFAALTPALIADVVTTSELAESELSGIVASSICIAALASQLSFAKFTHRTQIIVAAYLICSGLVCLGFSIIVPNLPALIIGGMLAGGGAGLIFVASVTAAASLAPPEQKGETISAIYFAAYLGKPIPVIGTGIGLSTVGPLITIPIFGTLIFALVVWCCLRMLRTNKHDLPTTSTN